MCLTVKEDEAIIAEEDIVVYKIVKKSENERFIHYYTLFRYMTVCIGAQYSLDHYEEEYFYRGIHWGEVEYGFHSFSEKSAKDYIQYITKHSAVVILKCIIPKGSYYIKGVFASAFGYFDSYASTSIKYLEEV